MAASDVFTYIKPLWENRQGEVSLRAVLAIAFSIHLMIIDRVAVTEVIFTEAGLITALLGITALQNIQDKRTETDLQKTVVKTRVGKTDDDDDPDVQVNTVNIKK